MSRVYIPLTSICGIIAFALLFTWGCSKEATRPTPSNFDEVINGEGDYENPIPRGKTEEPLGMAEEHVRDDGTSWLCREKEVSIENAPEEFVLLAASSTTGIFPGAILHGNALEADPPPEVLIDRGPGTILIRLQTGQGDVSRDVQQVSAASITNAVNDLIKDRTEFPSTFSFDFSRVEASEELRLAMNIKTTVWGAKVSTKFGFESDTSYERWLIKLVQPFYTIEFLPPNDPSKWFGQDVTPSQLASKLGSNNPPVYVRTVTYGRIAYLLLETTASRTEVEASLDVSAGVTSGHVDANYMSKLENANIKAVVYGGSANISDMEAALSGDGIEAAGLLTAEQEISKGVPIAYTMYDIKNNRPVKVKMAGSFKVRDCEPSLGGTKFTFLSRQDLPVFVGGADEVKVGNFGGDTGDDLLWSQINPGQTAEFKTSISGNGLFQIMDGATVQLGTGMTNVHVADLAGDGYDDLVWDTQATDRMSVTVWENTGSGFEPGSMPASSIPHCNTNQMYLFGQYRMHAGSFEAAGKDAVAWVVLVSFGMNIIPPITRDDLVGPPSCIGSPVDFWGTTSDWSGYETHIADFTGDGLDDWIWTWVRNNVALVWRAQSRTGMPALIGASGGVFGTSFTNVPAGASWTTATGDVDGDGIADIVWVGSSGALTAIVGVSLGSSNGNFLRVGTDVVYDNLGAGPFELRLGEVNNSPGAEVFLYRVGEPNSINVLKDYSPSTGRFNVLARVRHENPDNLSKSEWGDYEVKLMNVGGDVRDDLVWHTANGKIYVAIAED